MQNSPSVMRNSWMTWVLVAMVSMTSTGCLYQDLEVLEVEDFSKVKLSFDGLECRMDVDLSLIHI